MLSARARSRLATILIGVFLVQAALRLALMKPLFKTGYLTPVVHSVTLVVFFTLCAAVLARWPGRRGARMAVSAAMAAFWVLLTVFDIDAFIASRMNFQPISPSSFSVFYCEGKGLAACFDLFPTLILSAVAVAVAAIAAVALLIYPCVDDIQRRALALFGLGDRLSRRWLRVSGAVGLQSLCVLYALLWMIDPVFMARREPVTFILYIMPFEDGPVELAGGKRPNFAFPPATALRPRPLVLITVDALRADHVGLEPGKPTLTPFLRSLAVQGKLRSLGPAIAICASSYCGISAIQSGSGWATLQKGPPPVIADVLAANGYQSHFLLTGLHQSTANLRDIYGPNVTSFHSDNSPDSGMQFDDRDQIRRLARLQIGDPSQSFIAIHLMSVHAVGLRFEPNYHKALNYSLYSNMLPSYRRHYAAGVRQADHVIERLFAQLSAKGVLDDALVIITADHGERLGIPGMQAHGGDFDKWSSLIPLLVYDPRGATWPAHRLISQTDIAPTLIDAVGIDPPAAWDGHSLLRPQRRVAAPVDSAHAAGMAAIVDGRRLLFHCRLKTGATRVEPIDGPPLSKAEEERALRAASGLYATLPKRKDDQKCFSRT